MLTLKFLPLKILNMTGCVFEVSMPETLSFLHSLVYPVKSGFNSPPLLFISRFLTSFIFDGQPSIYLMHFILLSSRKVIFVHLLAL